MNYGYARVSTIKHGRGNSLEEELSGLFSSGCDVVIEEKFSGKTNDRPQLKLLLDKSNFLLGIKSPPWTIDNWQWIITMKDWSFSFAKAKLKWKN